MGCSQSKAVERVEPSPKFEEPLKIEQVIQEAATSGLVSDDASTHSNISSSSRYSRKNGSLSHSISAVGLDTMNEIRHEEGNLMTNMIPFELPFGRAIEDVYDGVHDGQVLGSGISGIVRQATHKSTGHLYAVKCLDLDLIETAEGLEQLRDEIYIMCQLDHPNIIRLEEVYESHNEIFLVQELARGGELFDRLDEQPDYHYTEEQCAKLVKEMLCSVRYLHSKGIIHRDLKLENFLFASRSSDSELKMIDFGLSKHFKYGEVHHEAVGTPYTVAPEVIRGSYDARCDVWAIGVIAYLLLSGDPPFGGCGGPESLHTVKNNILSGNFKYEPEEIWVNVSQQAKDFIKALLVTDPSKRPTAEGAQQLPWIKEFSKRRAGSSSNSLNPNVVRSLVAFKEYSDMRKLLCEVLSFTLLPNQIKNLRQEFEVLDKEGTGEISLQSLKSVLMNSANAGSLGALSESEVEDIFNAMRVRESETTIHWHEFIAAGLSQCQVDDRNLRLAFDRMDVDHKGYITFKNVLNLLGSDGASEERVRRLYFDGLEDYQINDLHITYDDFLAVMKGQSTSELKLVSQEKTPPNLIGIPGKLHMVPEISTEIAMEPSELPQITESPSGEACAFSIATLTPPESPSSRGSPLARGRSVSLGNEGDLVHSNSIVPSNLRRTLNLPEHNHDNKEMERLLHDESKTALVVNRNLYRAHRQMRQAVLDASKRLEEAQIRRLVKEEEQKLDSSLKGRTLQSAGLVMRRGQREQMSSEAVRKILEARMLEQQEQLAKANKQAGRGRRRRKKTVSDMTGMFGPTPPPAKQAATDDKLLSCPPSPGFRVGMPIVSKISPKENAPFLPSIQLGHETHRKNNSDVGLNFVANPSPSPEIQQKKPVVAHMNSWPPPPPL